MRRLYELHKCPEKYVGDIEVSGWIKTARESKNVGFIELGDGSAFRSVQVDYVASAADEEFRRAVEIRKVAANGC